MAIMITSQQELMQIGVSPDYPGNGSYILSNDIYVDGAWTMLMTTDGFSFNGGGHRITNLSMPLFTTLESATITNLTLELAIDTRDMEYPGGYGAIGGLFQQAYSSAITAVRTLGSVMGVSAVGGLGGDSSLCLFTDCENQANVLATDERAGGLVSLADNCRFLSCINRGTVTVDTASYAGGIAGIYQVWELPNQASPAYEVTACENHGAIRVDQYGGGLFGMLLVSPTGNYFQLQNARNHASVSPSTAAGGFDMGGIAGAVVLGGNLNNCLNEGAISGVARIGGITGCVSKSPFYQAEAVRAVLLGCRNSGMINLFAPLTPPPQGGYGMAGGIAGLLNHMARLIQCQNAGTVISNMPYTGGIAGAAFSGVIEECQNTGAVNGTSRVGGIAGGAGPVQTQVFFNQPPVRYVMSPTAQEAAPTVPPRPSPLLAPETAPLILANTLAAGTAITATGNEVGGIAGYMAGGAQVLDNRSCGRVESSGMYVGGLVGFSDAATASAANTITGNLVSSPSVSGASFVYRVLGGVSPSAVTALNNTRIFGNVLLTGNNTAEGGVLYENQPVSPGDTQLGATLRQGATLVCPPGQRLQSCVGCVPDGSQPCPPHPDCHCPCNPPGIVEGDIIATHTIQRPGWAWRTSCCRR